MLSFARTLASVASLMMVSATLAACGTDAGEPDAGGAKSTMTTEFGETELPETTDRIVTLGFTDHDMVLALGKMPVGLNRWYESMENGVGPWAEDELRGTTPELFTNWAEIPPEDVAALEPDAILGLYFDFDQKTYDNFSKIAPTLAPPAGYIPYGVPWQESAEMTGEFLGQANEAEAIVDDVEDQIAEVRKAHPEFEGRTVNYVRYQDDGTFYAYTKQDLRIRFLEELGFELAPAVDELEDEAFTTSISPEKADLLEADVLIVNSEEALEQPTAKALDVVGDGGAFVMDPDTEMAALASTVLSIPYALDRLADPLSDAVEGK